MITQEMKEKAEEARRNGYIVFDLTPGPMHLDKLIAFVQDIFPNHQLSQLAINEADEGEFVVAAEIGIETKPS